MSKKRRSVLRGGLIAFIAIMLFLPVILNAGSLEPSAAPAPTMKTLDQIPPTWSQKLPASERFVLVLDNAAVLDKETGLVWEKSPATTTATWYVAKDGYPCVNKTVGGRRGWHLPTIEQLISLVDPTQSNPALPSGHPFVGVQSSSSPFGDDLYWSATTYAGSTTGAWGVSFGSGGVGGGLKTYYYYVWCVRGGQSYDAY